MSNARIATHLRELATYLELDGTSKTTVRALSSAADKVEALESALSDEHVDGLPAAAQPYVREILEGGSAARHTELEDALGRVALHLRQIKGVGVAMAKRLIQEHDITSLDVLIARGEAGELAQVKGLGAKTIAKVLDGARALAAEMAVTESQPAEDPVPETVVSDQGSSMLDPSPEEMAGTEARPTEDPDEDDEEDEAPISVVRVARPSRDGEVVEEPEVVELPQRPLPPGLPVTVASGAGLGAVMQCPTCGGVGFSVWSGHATCGGCGRAFASEGGVLDLAQEPGASSTWQWLMDSRVYPWMYERFARPSFTRLLAGRSLADEVDLAVDLLSLEEARKTDETFRVLDVACGTGVFTRAMAHRLGEDGEVIGVDLSRTMLQQAQRRAIGEGLGHVHYVRCDAMALPFADDSVHRVHCSAALHLLPEPASLLQELERVLVPGGVAVLSTFHTGTLPVIKQIKKFVVGTSGIRLFEPDELVSLVEGSGLAPEREQWRWSAVSLAARKALS